MKAAVIGPSLWIDAPSDPVATQARVADVLRLLGISEVRPFVTLELRRRLVESPELQQLLRDFRSPEYAQMGVVGDQFVRALFGLLTEAWVPDATCLWDKVRDVVDDSVEARTRAAVHDEFIAALASAEVEFSRDVSDHVVSRPDGAAIAGRVTDVMCTTADESDEIYFSYAVSATLDGWLSAQIGRLPSPRANIQAAMVGRTPAREWRVHAEFERSVAALPDTRPGRMREVYRACAIAIERDPQQLSAAEDEPLRQRNARNDGAAPRRLRIVDNSPAAPRLHYWLRADYVEIGVAVRHDEYRLPE